MFGSEVGMYLGEKEKEKEKKMKREWHIWDSFCIYFVVWGGGVIICSGCEVCIYHTFSYCFCMDWIGLDWSDWSDWSVGWLTTYKKFRVILSFSLS